MVLILIYLVGCIVSCVVYCFYFLYVCLKELKKKDNKNKEKSFGKELLKILFEGLVITVLSWVGFGIEIFLMKVTEL